MSRRALTDLRELYDYIAQDNPEAALAFLKDLTEKIEWMASVGLIGVRRDFIPGLRVFTYRDRCIYFTVTQSDLTVVRVLHGRQRTTVSDFQKSDSI